MKDIIKLQSRYASDNNYLEKIEGTDKSYKLKTETAIEASEEVNVQIEKDNDFLKVYEYEL